MSGRWAGFLGARARLRLAALEVGAQGRFQPLGALAIAGFAAFRHGPKG
jgi:hypothetical protein